MQKMEDMQVARNAHRRVQSSTTLNRKYVKRPTRATDIMVKTPSTTGSPKIQRYHTSPIARPAAARKADDMIPAQSHPMQTTARTRMQMRGQSMRTQPVTKMTAKELKEQAIKKALANAAKTPTLAEQITTKEQKKTGKIRFGASRVVLALSCAAAAVFAIAYFVNLNMPDISLRVAAMQTGINASYPGYIPRDYRLSSITSEDSKINLKFYNANTGDLFSLIEEKSSWDSNALLNNYVKPTFDENYTTVREQGITIYLAEDSATWVNGGIVYKLQYNNGALNNRQIRSIAVSL